MKLRYLRNYTFSFKSKPLVINHNHFDIKEESNSLNSADLANDVNSKPEDQLIILKYLNKEKTILKSKQNLLEFLENKNSLLLYPYPCKQQIFNYKFISQRKTKL